MNKWSVPLLLIIFAIFGAVLLLTQGKSDKNAAGSPLPSDAATFQAISLSPIQEQQQGANAQQGAQPTVGVGEGMKASYSAIIKTSKGNITVNLTTATAPNTIKNFLDKTKSGFYKNLTFHRVEDWVIQGGDPKGDGSGGGQMQTELNNVPFVRGSLGVARGGNINISNDAQFFITKTDASWLNQQYTNFGVVTDGLDVVDKMAIGDKILGITIQDTK
ncbi:MAG TPA: peptidylprolyl isomerase [Methylomirabilota bacterium]|nr:peptidylprolyl isomerase [Methylomirabilota bacterium]